MKELQLLWTDSCSVFESSDVKDENGTNVNNFVTKYENQRCRLSFINSYKETNVQTEYGAKVFQTVMLFLSSFVCLNFTDADTTL